MTLDERIKSELAVYAEMYGGSRNLDYQNKVVSAAIAYICEKVAEKDAVLRHAYIREFYKYARREQ